MSDINNQQQTKQEEIVTDEFTLFVGGLTPLTTKETLMSYFSKFGSITDVNLITDWVTSQSKCCAIIFCENSKTVNAILKVKAHLIDKKKVRVNTADVKKKGTKIIKTSKIFLGQVHPSITRTDLYDYFSDFGKIKHLRLMHNTYVPLKYSQNGYLEFYFQKDAQKLLEKRHALSIQGFKLNCQPFRALNVEEAEFFNMISNLGEEKLDQYLEIYFSIQIGIQMGMDKEFNQGEEELKNEVPEKSFAEFDMNMMPAIAIMMQNMMGVNPELATQFRDQQHQSLGNSVGPQINYGMGQNAYNTNQGSQFNYPCYTLNSQPVNYNQKSPYFNINVQPHQRPHPQAHQQPNTPYLNYNKPHIYPPASNQYACQGPHPQHIYQPNNHHHVIDPYTRPPPSYNQQPHPHHCPLPNYTQGHTQPLKSHNQYHYNYEQGPQQMSYSQYPHKPQYLHLHPPNPYPSRNIPSHALNNPKNSGYNNNKIPPQNYGNHSGRIYNEHQKHQAQYNQYDYNLKKAEDNGYESLSVVTKESSSKTSLEEIPIIFKDKKNSFSKKNLNNSSNSSTGSQRVKSEEEMYEEEFLREICQIENQKIAAN